jgi:hypothetical protein
MESKYFRNICQRHFVSYKFYVPIKSLFRRSVIVIFSAIFRKIIFIFKYLRSVEISQHCLNASSVLVVCNTTSIIRLPNSIIKCLKINLCVKHYFPRNFLRILNIFLKLLNRNQIIIIWPFISNISS